MPLAKQFSTPSSQSRSHAVQSVRRKDLQREVDDKLKQATEQARDVEQALRDGTLSIEDLED